MINKRQEKELAELIEYYGLEKTDFKVENLKSNEYKSEEYKRLLYLGTDYFFSIHDGDYSGNFNVGFSPNDNDMIGSFVNLDWKWVKNKFAFWLENLKEEMLVKDIWTTISENKGLFETQFGDDENFTKDEIRLLEINLDDINEKVQKEASIPDEKKKLLTESFEYLKKVAKRVTKLDWVNIAVGLILRLALTVDNVKFVFGLLKYIFSGKFLQ